MRHILRFIILLLIIPAACTNHDRYIALSGFAQGGTYTVKINTHAVGTRPEILQRDVDSLLKVIDGSLSGYNKASLLSRLNAGDTIRPDAMLCRIYDMAYGFYVDSEGALDVSAGPLFDIWGFGFTSDSLPSQAMIDAAMARSGMSRLKPKMEDAIRPDGTLCASDLLLDPSQDPPVLNFNAIAQGFTSDVIAEYLRSRGVEDMLVDIGEIFCAGLNPSRLPWSISIDTPFDGNLTPGAYSQGVWHSSPEIATGQGIVTSGNYRKYYVRDGRKYSHTIDPRTGYPVGHNLLSATVVAPDATTADAVATWCMVIGYARSMLLLHDLGLEGCLIYEDEGKMMAWSSPCFGISTSR